MPPGDPYPIIPLSKEDVLAPEEMGSKRKGWVQVGVDLTPWLFKHARLSNGEAVSAAIANRDERDVAFSQLAGYVTLDALILNTDRHHENWALIRARSSDGRLIHRVAPTFDHASSLGRNEPVEKLGQWLVCGARARGHLYPTDGFTWCQSVETRRSGGPYLAQVLPTMGENVAECRP